jgi:hypothetical protein
VWVMSISCISAAVSFIASLFLYYPALFAAGLRPLSGDASVIRAQAIFTRAQRIP